MSTPHAPRWHTGSLFGSGPRRPLDREQRARFRFLLNAHRRAHHLTPYAELVGTALLKRLSIDGQCDPAHDTIATDVGCSARTVRRALEALKGLGLAGWQRRIVRTGWRVEQTSNAYVLVPQTTSNPPVIRAFRTGGHSGRETLSESFILMSAPEQDVAAARDALARRRAAIEQRLLGKIKRPRADPGYV